MKSSQNEMRKSLKYLLVFVLLFVAGMAVRDIFLSGDKDESLLFYCGAGLRPAVSEIVESFEDETGIHIRTNYGASNILLGQIKVNREGDLFMPGDEIYVQEAMKDDLVLESHSVTVFIPVIMVQKGNPHNIQHLDDLSKPGVKLGIADERAAAIGRITWLIYEKNDISRELIEDNIVFDSVTVHELVTGITLGHVDAAIVWEPVARGQEEAEVIEIPYDNNITVPVPLAMLSSTRDQENAGRFIEYMLSEESQSVFEKHRFGRIQQ